MVVVAAVGMRNVWRVPSIVTLYVDCANRRVGAASAKPRRDIVKNILQCYSIEDVRQLRVVNVGDGL